MLQQNGLTELPKKLGTFYWWVPEVPEYRTSEPHSALRLEQYRLPRIGQRITWLLSQPESSQELPLIIAHGEVNRVLKPEMPGGDYQVLMDRVGSLGLSYTELCHCIGAQVVGFHPEYGCLQGELKSLLPASELAAVLDPIVSPTLVDDGNDEGWIWVDWSTIWTVEGLEIMHPTKGAQKKKSSSQRKKDTTR